MQRHHHVFANLSRSRRALTIAVAWVVMFLGNAASAATALVADRLIDARSAKPLANAVVLVEGDRITAIGDRSIIPPGAEKHHYPRHRDDERAARA